MVLPDGSTWGGGSPSGPVMRIRRDAFFDRLGVDGVIGFGEGYMVEDWTADGDLAEVLAPFAARTATHLPGWVQRFRRFYVQRQPSDEENTRGGAKSNIHRHYDLSNDLFSLFLDESMTYSSALFAPGDTLEDAQVRKIDRLLDATGVGPGTRVLEIGTGWGALAIRAARARARSSARSRCRESSRRSLVAGPRMRASPIASTSRSATTGTPVVATTPS